MHDWATVRRWEEKRPILYTTFGLTAEQAQIFSDLLTNLSKRVGLEVQPVTPDKIADVQIIAANAENDEVRKNLPRIIHVVGDRPLEKLNMLASANTALLKVHSRLRYPGWARSAQGRLEKCTLLLRANSLAATPDLAGFVVARQVYQCLTSFPTSDAVVSIMNTTPPPSLLSPPYAKFSALDSALLRIVYEPGDALFQVPQPELVARLEARLRAEGFRDDGTKP